MSRWIKKGDRVLVTCGNDRGRTGEVLSRKEERVVVQGINVRTKYIKRQGQASSKEPVSMEMAVHVSNLAPCNEEGKPLKLKVRFNKSGKKELVYRAGKKTELWRRIG